MCLRLLLAAVLLFKAIREGCRTFCSSCCRCLCTPRIPCTLPCRLYMSYQIPTQIGNISNFGISCIIPVPLNCIHTRVRALVKRSIPSFLGLPSFCHFKNLLACPFTVFMSEPGCPSSVFSCDFSHTEKYVALGPGLYVPASTKKYCTKYSTLCNSKSLSPKRTEHSKYAKKNVPPGPQCKVRFVY